MTTAARPQPCNTLWVGHGLGPLERTCLASFVEIGHPVRLYAYEDLSGVPAGVEIRDAGDVLPRAAVARHLATGHFSLVANRFRYLLQRADLGLWIDCDLLCLRPIPDAPFVFGRQDERRINNAVLRLPRGHPILSDLLAPFERPRWIPPFESLRRRIRYAVRHRLQPGFGVADMPWGTTGPNALTYHLARHGLTDRALPSEAFYPVGLREAGALLTPDHAAVRASLTDRTLCIHLWNKALSEQTGPPPRGSFLEAVLEGSWRDYLARGAAARKGSRASAGGLRRVNRSTFPLVTIVVPTRREVENLPTLVPEVAAAMHGAGLAFEIVIVDDDSRDGTEEVCASLSARFPLRLIVREGERGLATAVVAGLHEARGDTLVVMDADLAHPPRAIPALVAAVRQGRADLAIGSRYVEGGSTDAAWGVLRWLNSKTATLLARPLTRVSDPMAGFLALSRAALDAAARLDPVGYKIGLELIVKCGRPRIVEIPIHFTERVRGASKLSLGEQLRYLRHLGRLYAFRLGGVRRRAHPPAVLPGRAMR